MRMNLIIEERQKQQARQAFQTMFCFGVMFTCMHMRLVNQAVVCHL